MGNKLDGASPSISVASHVDPVRLVSPQGTAGKAEMGFVELHPSPRLAEPGGLAAKTHELIYWHPWYELGAGQASYALFASQ